MIILTIDSAMNGCAAGVFDASGVLAEKSIETSRGQAEHLIPIIDDVIKSAGFGYDNINRIAVTKGPGAFTGLRIGLSAAKTLGLVLKRPVFGVCTFGAVFETYLLQQDAPKNKDCCVILETKRKDYYAQLFDVKTHMPISEATVASAAEIQEKILRKNPVIIGDAIERFHEEADITLLEKYHVKMPSLAALDRIVRQMSDTDANSEPVYLRGPEIGVSKKKMRQLKS